MSTPTITEAETQRPFVRGRNGRVVVREFDVIARSMEDAHQKIGQAGDITEAIGGPIRRGTIYVDHTGNQPDAFVVCTNIEVTTRSPGNLSNNGLYRVACTYNIPEMARQTPPEPTTLTTQWTVESSTFVEPVDTDINGPITNTANQPIAGVSRMTGADTLVGIRMFPFPDYLSAYAAFKSYHLKVNSNTWFGAPPRCLLCRSIQVEDASLLYNVGNTLFRIEFRFEYKAPKGSATYIRSGSGFQSAGGVTLGGWDDIVLNVGQVRVRIINDKRFYAAMTDPDGFVITAPLDMEGKAIEQATGQPPTVAVKHYQEADFGDLPI